MMKEEKIIRLRFSYAGQTYVARINSARFAETMVINRLKIGCARYWLIFENDSWRFIGDMPLCRGLKDKLVSKIAGHLDLPGIDRAVMIDGQLSLRTGIVVNAILSAIALKSKL